MNNPDPIYVAASRLARGSLDRNGVLPIDQVAEGLTACYQNAASLLEDAKELWFLPRPHRALSLTILALEELAKIPELHDQFTNPLTRTDAKSWKEFWARFITHKPKQKRITAYGEKLTGLGWSPFSVKLNSDVVGLLDSVKQRGFYVDYVAPRFLEPAGGADVTLVFENLYLFAAERLGAFGSWHVSTQRSLDFLSVCATASSADRDASAAAFRKSRTFYDWASTHTENELLADGTRALYYYTSEDIPDYSEFLGIFADIYSRCPADRRQELMRRIVVPLRSSMEKPLGHDTQARDFKMFKLAFSFGTRALSDAEMSELFGLAPGASDRARFQES